MIGRCSGSTAFGNISDYMLGSPLVGIWFRARAPFGREAFYDSALRFGRPLLKIEVILSFSLTL